MVTGKAAPQPLLPIRILLLAVRMAPEVLPEVKLPSFPALLMRPAFTALVKIASHIQAVAGMTVGESPDGSTGATHSEES